MTAGVNAPAALGASEASSDDVRCDACDALKPPAAAALRSAHTSA